jgi:outer membrane protein assembly factor BamA
MGMRWGHEVRAWFGALLCAAAAGASAQAPGTAPQKSHILVLRPAPKDLPESLLPRERQPDAAAADAAVAGAVAALRREAWPLASAERERRTRDSTVYRFEPGPEVGWLRLGPGNVDERALRTAGYRERDYLERPFRYERVMRLADRLLREAENNGYPFAEAGLDSVAVTPEGVRAVLRLDRYRFVALDSLRVLGNARVAPEFLRQYLDLREGRPYDEGAVRAMPARIRELAFLRQSAPPVVRFYGDKAVVGIYLEEVNANQFDFLLGVLPNSAITGRLALTGEANLQLVNTFALGERLGLAYRRLQAGTQELDLNLAFPYLPYLPVGAHLDFDLYLRDSTFLERGTDFGLRYAFGGADYLEGFWENGRYVLLDPDTASIRANRSLPENLDVAVNRYGIALQRERLDYRFNPRRGWRVWLKGSAGTREVLENARITAITDPAAPDFDYATLYDSVGGRVASFRLEGRAAGFVPIGARSTVMLGWEGGLLRGGTLLRNELFRLGGYRRLRGFDEESLFASHFHIATIEYRFLLATNSAVSLFADGAWLEERRLGENRRDTPIGFGAGLDFETGAGIFGLRYALGTQRGNPIAFREAKLHFGYVNRF